MATQTTHPARPASTPPTTTRRTRQTTAGAHASATPTPSTGSSQKAAPKKTPTDSAKQWIEAERIVPDLDAALVLLQKNALIPEGSHAVSRASLTTGLLHFALTSPKHARAQEGLIAFAFLAQEVFKREDEDGLRQAVSTVVEQAGHQMALRLDQHTSHVEAKLGELQAKAATAEKEVRSWSGWLQEATERVGRAEEALEQARAGITAAKDTPELADTPPPLFPPLTLDTVPVRTRRAVALADLLQRQVMVDNVDIPTPDGEPLTALSLQEKGQRALDDLTELGLLPPDGGKIVQAKILKPGVVVFTTSSVDMASWMIDSAVAAPFAVKMGMHARVVERTYKLIAERVPLSFRLDDEATLREVERAHGLKDGAITQATWIKPPDRRSPGQRTAYVALTIAGVDQANAALKGLTLAGRQVLVRRDLKEPQRCSKCQRYDGHFARDCKAEHDTCANCAGAHPTSQCTSKEPHALRCANCKEDGHAAWDRDCPTLRAKVRAQFARQPDAGFRFFVTNNPETWIHESEELEQAPPPPRPWLYDRPRNEHAGMKYGARQGRLDDFYAPAPSQQSRSMARQ